MINQGRYLYSLLLIWHSSLLSWVWVICQTVWAYSPMLSICCLTVWLCLLGWLRHILHSWRELTTSTPSGIVKLKLWVACLTVSSWYLFLTIFCVKVLKECLNQLIFMMKDFYKSQWLDYLLIWLVLHSSMILNIPIKREKRAVMAILIMIIIILNSELRMNKTKSN